MMPYNRFADWLGRRLRTAKRSFLPMSCCRWWLRISVHDGPPSTGCETPSSPGTSPAAAEAGDYPALVARMGPAVDHLSLAETQVIPSQRDYGGFQDRLRRGDQRLRADLSSQHAIS